MVMIARDDPPPRNSRRRAWLDGFAIGASSLCALHCLGLPLLLALLPALAARIDPGESFHISMLALAVPTSLFALIRGRRRRGTHRIILGMCGIALMTIGAFLTSEPRVEAAWTVTGSVMLAIAHILNWRRGTRAVAVARPAR